MADQPTTAEQDYLKAIHRLGGAEQQASPADIAARLGVRAPSVTGMLKRLAEARWIDYEPGRGARLTERGIAEARRVIRRHRLIELLLTRVLGLDWSEVDAEAEAIEHAVSPRMERRWPPSSASRTKTPTAIPSRRPKASSNSDSSGRSATSSPATASSSARPRTTIPNACPLARPRPDARRCGSHRRPSTTRRLISDRGRRPRLPDGPRRTGRAARRTGGMIALPFLAKSSLLSRIRTRFLSLFVLTNNLVPLN